MTMPLAEKMRPTSLNEIIGQTHLVGDAQILHKIIANKIPVSLVLWGPPGCGKTTLARIIAREVDGEFEELSAVTSGVADVRKIIESAKINNRLNRRTILFVDEIHRFSKSQQDAFLPHVESGLITLIGATTENPSVEVIRPLLSRMKVLNLRAHSREDLQAIVVNAATSEGFVKRLKPDAIEALIDVSNGDARIALGSLELAAQLTDKKITAETVKLAVQKQLPNYDKNGENHYNLLSAFIKSMRGSSVDGALYYLARMLQGGEDPKTIARRMVIFASEDIGLAGNGALQLATSTFAAVEKVGMPECQYALFHCAAALAKGEKSRAVTDAMAKAQHAAGDYPNLPVPLHLRNIPGQPHRTNAKGGFLPPELKDLHLL